MAKLDAYLFESVEQSFPRVGWWGIYLLVFSVILELVVKWAERIGGLL